MDGRLAAAASPDWTGGDLLTGDWPAAGDVFGNIFGDVLVGGVLAGDVLVEMTF